MIRRWEWLKDLVIHFSLTLFLTLVVMNKVDLDETWKTINDVICWSWFFLKLMYWRQFLYQISELCFWKCGCDTSLCQMCSLLRYIFLHGFLKSNLLLLTLGRMLFSSIYRSIKFSCYTVLIYALRVGLFLLKLVSFPVESFLVPCLIYIEEAYRPPFFASSSTPELIKPNTVCLLIIQ